MRNTHDTSIDALFDTLDISTREGHDTETDELIGALASSKREVHDTDADELIGTPGFSKAVTRELADGVPILPADETPTLKIIRITDQDLLNDFESDQTTKVPVGDE